MAHVVMQAAEFPDLKSAESAMARLTKFKAEYIEFETLDPNPWSWESVPSVLTSFGREFGIEWPHQKSARFLLKGTFAEASELRQAGRLIFFWGGGFEMGGDTLRTILKHMGATKTVEFCEIMVRSDDPDGLIETWVELLEANDFEDQYILDPDDGEDWLHTIMVKGDDNERLIAFDDSGVSDWAFVSLISLLQDLNPNFT